MEQETDIEKLRKAAKCVVDAYWDAACEDYYRAAGKSQHSDHPFKALVDLKLFVDAGSEE